MKNSKYLFIVLVFGLLLQSCKSYTSNIIFKAEPTDMNWKSAYEKAVVENPNTENIEKTRQKNDANNIYIIDLTI